MFNFPDSPTDGQVFTPPGGPAYVYSATVGAWKAQFSEPGTIAPVPEAPMDSQTYARQNATWVSLTGGAVDATPVGTVIMTARTTAPAGYLICNGASLLRAGTYAALFAAIGTTYGAVDGTHFNIPEMRGEFVRGFDSGRGVDSGRVQGTSQAGAVESHTHTFTGSAMGTHAHPAGTTGTESADHTHTFSDTSSTTSSAGAHTHTTTLYAASVIVVTDGVADTGYRATAGNTAYASSSAGAHTHTVSVSGTTSGRSAAHTHSFTTPAVSAGTPAGTISNYPASGAETRPRNVALLMCIKF